MPTLLACARAAAPPVLAALLAGCVHEGLPADFSTDPFAPSGAIKTCKTEPGAALAPGKPGLRVTGLREPFSLVLPASGRWLLQCDDERPFFAASLPRRYLVSVFAYQNDDRSPIDLQVHMRKRMQGLIRKRAQDGFEGDYHFTKSTHPGGDLHGFVVSTRAASDGSPVMQDAIFFAVQPEPNKLLFLHYDVFYATEAERVELMREIGDTIFTFSPEAGPAGVRSRP